MSGKVYDSIEQALTEGSWTDFPAGGCGYSCGSCKRLSGSEKDKDLYEPNEPMLEQAGLPWFYFIPSTEQLAEPFHEEYIREAEALWGTDQAEGAHP